MGAIPVSYTHLAGVDVPHLQERLVTGVISVRPGAQQKVRLLPVLLDRLKAIELFYLRPGRLEPVRVVLLPTMIVGGDDICPTGLKGKAKGAGTTHDLQAFAVPDPGS